MRIHEQTDFCPNLFCSLKKGEREGEETFLQESFLPLALPFLQRTKEVGTEICLLMNTHISIFA